MQVPDQGGGLQKSVSHLFITAPSAFDGEGNGVDVEETVTAGTGGNSDCFAHVADCRHRSLEHASLLPVVEMIEPVGVADKFGDEAVRQGHGTRLPGGRQQQDRLPEFQARVFASFCDADASRRVDTEERFLTSYFIRYSYPYH